MQENRLNLDNLYVPLEIEVYHNFTTTAEVFYNLSIIRTINIQKLQLLQEYG